MYYQTTRIFIDLEGELQTDLLIVLVLADAAAGTKPKPTVKPEAKKVTTPKVTTPKPTKPPKPNEEGTTQP